MNSLTVFAASLDTEYKRLHPYNYNTRQNKIAKIEKHDHGMIGFTKVKDMDYSVDIEDKKMNAILKELNYLIENGYDTRNTITHMITTMARTKKGQKSTRNLHAPDPIEDVLNGTDTMVDIATAIITLPNDITSRLLLINERPTLGADYIRYLFNNTPNFEMPIDIATDISNSIDEKISPTVFEQFHRLHISDKYEPHALFTYAFDRIIHSIKVARFGSLYFDHSDEAHYQYLRMFSGLGTYAVTPPESEDIIKLTQEIQQKPSEWFKTELENLDKIKNKVIGDLLCTDDMTPNHKSAFVSSFKGHNLYYNPAVVPYRYTVYPSLNKDIHELGNTLEFHNRGITKESKTSISKKVRVMLNDPTRFQLDKTKHERNEIPQSYIYYLNKETSHVPVFDVNNHEDGGPGDLLLQIANADTETTIPLYEKCKEAETFDEDLSKLVRLRFLKRDGRFVHDKQYCYTRDIGGSIANGTEKDNMSTAEKVAFFINLPKEHLDDIYEDVKELDAFIEKTGGLNNVRAIVNDYRLTDINTFLSLFYSYIYLYNAAQSEDMKTYIKADINRYFELFHTYIDTVDQLSKLLLVDMDKVTKEAFDIRIKVSNNFRDTMITLFKPIDTFNITNTNSIYNPFGAIYCKVYAEINDDELLKIDNGTDPIAAQISVSMIETGYKTTAGKFDKLSSDASYAYPCIPVVAHLDMLKCDSYYDTLKKIVQLNR